MRFGMSEEASLKYIAEISEIIKPLNPILIYIDQPNVKATVDSVLDERGNDWLNAVIDYHTSQGYGKQNSLSGYEGYIQCLEERKKRELRILQALSIDHYTISQDMNVEEFEALYASVGWNCPPREQMAGTLLYRFSENYIRSTLKENWKTCIDLRASKGKEPFYSSLGFQIMSENENGSGMEKMLE